MMDANILNHDGIACCVVEKIAILEGGGGGGGVCVCGGGGVLEAGGLLNFSLSQTGGLLEGELIRRGLTRGNTCIHYLT